MDHDPQCAALALFVVLNRRAGLNVYKREVKPGTYEFRATGLLKVGLGDYKVALLDHEYRVKWDDNAKDIRAVDGLENVFVWLQRYPWPMADREYVFERALRKRGDLELLVAKSMDVLSLPPGRKNVRVTDYRQLLAFAPAEGGVRFALKYTETPGTNPIGMYLSSSLQSFANRFRDGALNSLALYFASLFVS